MAAVSNIHRKVLEFDTQMCCQKQLDRMDSPSGTGVVVVRTLLAVPMLRVHGFAQVLGFDTQVACCLEQWGNPTNSPSESCVVGVRVAALPRVPAENCLSGSEEHWVVVASAYRWLESLCDSMYSAQVGAGKHAPWVQYFRGENTNKGGFPLSHWAHAWKVAAVSAETEMVGVDSHFAGDFFGALRPQI